MKITTILPLGSAMFLLFAMLGCHGLTPGDMMSASTQRTPLVGDHNDHHGNGDSGRNAGLSDSCSARHQDSCSARHQDSCSARHQDSCSMDMEGMHDMMHSGGGGMHDMMHSGNGGMHGSGMHGDSCMTGMTMDGMDSCKKK